MSFQSNWIRIFCFLFAFIFLCGFQLKREENGSLTLIENTCEQAKKTLTDFSDWKKTSDGSVGCDPGAFNYQSNGNRCAVDSTKCLPEHVQKYQGVNPEVAGPNCWNLALVMSKILPNHRYTNEKEFLYYMRPPLCRALKNGEERKPGDVGAMWDANSGNFKDQTHGFVYINQNVVYSKNGLLPMNAYSVQSLTRMSEIFGVETESKCFSNQRNDNCEIGTSFFRCQSMNEYLAKSKNIPTELKEAFHESEKFDDCFEKFEMSGAPLTNEATQNIRQTGAALAQYLQEQRDKSPQPKANSEEEFMLGALQVRLGSLYDQLDNLGDYPNEKNEVEKLRDLISKTK